MARNLRLPTRVPVVNFRLQDAYDPHPAQRLIHSSPARFRVVCCVLPEEVIPGDYRPILELGVGDGVLGEDGRVHRVAETFRHGYRGQIFSIKARYLMPMRVTQEHPVWVVKVEMNENFYALSCGRRPKKRLWRVVWDGWMEAGQISRISLGKKERLMLKVPRIVGSSTHVGWPLRKMGNKDRGFNFFPLDRDTAWLLGLYVAEGNGAGSSVQFNLGHDEGGLCARAERILKGLGYVPRSRKIPTGVRVYVCHTALKELFERCCGRGASNKRIPEEVLFHADPAIPRSFLRGYSDGDGWVDTKRGKWSAKTNSEVLALQVQSLVARFGEMVSLGKADRKPTQIDGRVVSGGPAYRMEGTGKILLEVVGFTGRRKADREYFLRRDDCLLVPIQRVDSWFYEGDVCNLSTGSETYLVSNAVTHNCGRRFGKTMLAMGAILGSLKEVAERLPQTKVPRAWVVAPTFGLVEEDWRVALQLYGPILLDRNVAKMQMILALGDGRVGEIEFKSAERGDEGLRGAGIAFVVMDEASRIPRIAWEQGIRPALADLKGRGIFISTPFGRNFFYELWLQGHLPAGQAGRKDDREWESWQFPSIANPHFPRDEWEKIKATTPEATFRQEYLAEFVENSTSTFQKLDGVSTFVPPRREEGVTYSIGVDLARTLDFTVIAVLSSRGTLTELHRSKDLDWAYQKQLIKTYWSRYQPCRLTMDISGVGDVIESDLRRDGVAPMDGVRTGSVIEKAELIEQLAIAIEQGMIRIPNERLFPSWAWLWEELRSFTSERLESGNIRYMAPEGRHDDGVMALALAVWGTRQTLGVRQDSVVSKSPYLTWGQDDGLDKGPYVPRIRVPGGVQVRPGVLYSPA